MKAIDEILPKESPLTFWIEFFKNLHSEQIETIKEIAPEIEKAKEIFDRAKFDPEARELIRIRKKAIRDYFNDIANAEDRGKAEKARETAINLLKMKLSVEQSSKATGLSLKEVEKLKKEL